MTRSCQGATLTQFAKLIPMDDLYRENILEHYRHPHNFGKLDNPDIEKQQGNPFCGDQIGITIKLSGNKKEIKSIKFDGQGCAISIASASLLTDFVTGRQIKEIMNLKKEKVIELLGVSLSPTRLKCALLPLETIQSALSSRSK